MTKTNYLIQLKEKINDHFDYEEFRHLVFDLGVDFDNIPGRAKIDKIVSLVNRMNSDDRISQLTQICQKFRPKVVWTYQVKLFIAYKQNTLNDANLAKILYDSLNDKGHDVFYDQGLRAGEEWLDRIDAEIKAADFLVVLLSTESIDSEMVRSEIYRAKEYHTVQGKPQILPIRVAFNGMLPYGISAFLNPKQYIYWHSANDNQKIVNSILLAINEKLPEKSDPFSQIPNTATILSVDGRLLSKNELISPPSPEFDPRLIKHLSIPGGALSLSDKFYVEREEDNKLRQEIVRRGTTITIRAPRQTGKTSLLMRGLHYAREKGAQVIFLDGQSLGLDEKSEMDTFLRSLAELLVDELRIDGLQIEKSWNDRLVAQKNLTNLIEDHILSRFEEPIILAFDEADALLETRFYQHFFGLLRSWHNRRAMLSEWEKLNIVLVISTEPYILIDNINSPFNVGLKLNLTDFSQADFELLNYQHGSPLNEAESSQAFDLLNGQPYLTRKLLYLLARNQLSWQEIEKKATSDNGPFGDHLRRLNWGIRTQSILQKALLQIISTGRCSNEDAIFRLQKAGLVIQNGDIVTCRCGLYAQYFGHKLG
ncbi:MAG: hypothetical protein CL609_07555 [Anaerolineaceae bacterium]|nr:hypothetical protein [Anaerolineaceae bacterium]